MKIKNKLHLILSALLLSLFIVPANVFAYSNYVISGGNTIGIEVQSKGVLVVGFYKIDDNYVARDAGFMIGDIILEVNNNKVNDINSMINLIEKSVDNNISFKVLRNGKEKNVTMGLLKDSNGVLKTGLYVKDKINGIGTLTYIDPESKVFGALGHEIIESSTVSKFEIKDGKIYEGTVSGFVKSRNGKAGEKNATYDKNDVYGVVTENEIAGIFGKYSKDISMMDTIEVGKINDIFAGKGISDMVRTKNNMDGVDKMLDYAKEDFEGLCFVNLVDYDMLYGHRNDVEGYAKALTEFDERIPEILGMLKDDDILMITADHGCDPITPSTDHSREYTPLVMYGKNIKAGVNLGTRNTFADIATTILDYFGLKDDIKGTSMLNDIIR